MHIVMLVTIHDVRGLISMQESDGNVIGNKLKFLNISDEDDDGNGN